ncbi:VOC family protein [Caviibacterium pharyngocola]|uniref:Metalloprotein n=1 Tax=Caviibacterium pharyngocola TaxID=28159 RepID=A0A2M8RWW8_9PAST|nr:VOC family protein [Caviibacterium pharyngocola]PJG83380.1 metalloprotein [Caviibacterium pharyngocola]
MTTFNVHHPLFATNPTGLQEFIEFERKIDELAAQMRIRLSEYEIDHLAIRVNQRKDAEDRLTALLKCGTILSDNIVNGRNIYLIKLNEPLIFAGQTVDIVELPFPKNKKYLYDSWEHIELVMPFLYKESTNEWVERINSLFLWNRLTDLNVKISEPKVEGERLPNPSIAVSFCDERRNHTCIKVHPYNIKKIIEV